MTEGQNMQNRSTVMETSRREPETQNRYLITENRVENRPKWSWVEASIWTDGMLTALENGVKGGKWYDHLKWPNAFFANQGLFTMETARAHEIACRSR